MGVLLGGIRSLPPKRDIPAMALTDTAICAAKPKDRLYKLADSGGLYLAVSPAGARLWRLKYRFEGREKILSIGAYPAVPLALAREKREEAKSLFARGARSVAGKAGRQAGNERGNGQYVPRSR